MRQVPRSEGGVQYFPSDSALHRKPTSNEKQTFELQLRNFSRLFSYPVSPLQLALTVNLWKNDCGQE